MSKEANNEEELFELQFGLSGKHIREEISKQPKMSPVVAAHVARNLDELLEELKGEGIAMNEICRAAALGNPSDRDSKALYKYRNPEGSKLRDYISKAAKYVSLAEKIADIKGHPYSGTSNGILRRVFARTPYSPPLTNSGDASIALKKILDEVTNWIARQTNLAQAYERLLGVSEVRKSSASQQFEVLQKISDSNPLHLELGYRNTKIKDSKGQPLELKDKRGGCFNLCWGEYISLFIGIDDDSTPHPYVALQKILVATPLEPVPIPAAGAEPYNILFVGDGTHDGAEFGDLVFEGDKEDLYLPKEIVARTVDLVSLNKHLQDGGVDFGNNFEKENPVCTAFMLANPEYGYKEFSIGQGVSRPEIQTKPISADVLEYVEGFLGEPTGVFAPAGVWPTKALGDSSLYKVVGDPSLYGDGILARLISWFTGGLQYEVNSMEKEFLGDDIRDSRMAPSGGWIGVRPHLGGGHTWSAADILWLRCKMFLILEEARFVQETKKQKVAYDTLLQRLKGHDSSDFES